MANLKPNTETHRVRALAYLVARDLAQARLEIRKALELEPRWELIRLTAAVVDYFSALSPAVLPSHLVAWPEPVDWAYVKRDSESLALLRKAAEEFRDLAEGSEKTKEIQRFEAWRLACLANDWERQEEAIEYCRGILQADSIHYPAIAWAVARNFGVDLGPSEAKLEELVEDGLAAIPHILGLVSCYLASQKPKEAVQLLARTKPVFQRNQADTTWAFWYIQSLVANGDLDAALEVIDSSEPELELQGARIIVLRALARETGDWQHLVEYLETSYTETGDPNLLFENCRLMAQQQDWTYVADRAEQLVEEISTGEALRLAAIASFNTARFDLCLKLLSKHQQLFGHKLPIELRQIRIACQHSLGILPEAIAEAEALVREEPTVEGLLELAQLYFDKGDLRGVAVVARQLHSRPDLPAAPSLNIARFVQWEDRELARSLWRKAALQDLPDFLVGDALALGYQLGLDKELGPLLSRMVELGQQGLGGIQVATIQDIIAHARQYHQKEVKLNEAYRDGTVPVHVIAEQLNLPLVELYHGLLEGREAAPDLIRQPSLLIRHGGRALAPGFPDNVPEWRLNLDITALLLAAHLEILDATEEVFKPLHIPAPVMPALVQMRERVTHYQPSRIESCRQIIELVGSGSLGLVEYGLQPDHPNAGLVSELGEEFVACFERARADEGYLVCFLPLQKRDLNGPPSALPEDIDRYLVNCRGVVEALRDCGPLSNVEYINALKKLGDEGCKAGNETVPEVGTHLYFLENTIEVLADAELLSTVCERFQVHIGRREFERARLELREYERRSRLGDWLGSLVDRIGRGIDDGSYEIIPSASCKERPAASAAGENPEIACLLALLRFEAQEGDVIWADDRYVNSYLRRDTAPIIGINEVLKALVVLGALKPEDYYSKIIRLRAGNVRFIPIQTDEILYHLQQARVENDEVIETRELSILRRYVATCLVQSDTLQQPPLPENTPNELGEIAFILSLAGAINGALVELWMDEAASENDRLARAEWILRNLYLNHLGLRNLTSLPKSDQDERYLVAISLAGLISQAIVFGPSGDGDESSARRDYFEWLFSRVLQRQFDANPHLLEAVTELLKSLLPTQEDLPRSRDIELPALMWFLQAFYEDLPKPIREELWLDTDFMAKLGIRTLYAVTVDDLSFAAGDFFRAASEAVNGRKATITVINVDEEVTFESCGDVGNRGVFCFKHPAKGEIQAFANQDLELLLDSPSEREALLRRNRYWFDCLEETFNRAVAEIVSIEDPWRRIEGVKSWREASTAVFYHDLYEKLKERKAFGFSDLVPPSADGLLRHFRLWPTVGGGEEFHEALSVAAQALVCEEGLLPAMNRLAGLPIPLPATLVEAVVTLPAEERHTLIKRLVRIAGSPISKVHLMRILLRSGDETSALWRLALRIIKNLLSPRGVGEFDAFLAILRWVSDEFSQRSDMRTWPAHTRQALAWAHSHRLFATFAHLGIPTTWLHEVFSQANLRLPPEAFERDPKYWFDVSHPQRVSYVTFLISGLAYGLDERGAQFVDDRLRALLGVLAFRDLEGRRVPVPALLRDYTQASNSLLSFLGGDLGDKSSVLLSAEESDAIKQSSLQALVEQAINMLAEEGDGISGWPLLYAVLGGFPPYEDLADQLRSLIRQTNFVGLFERNVPAGNFAIQTASRQTMHLSDEDIRLYLKEQLIGMAQLFASWESGKVSCSAAGKNEFGRSQDLCASLIESALNIAAATQSSQDATAEFAELLAQLVEVWHSMTPVCKPIVQVLSEELAIADAQRFWPLLVRLRAE